MTTIAYDGKTLAADRRTSCGGQIWRSSSKIRKVGNAYIAIAGQIGQGAKLIEWIKAGKADPAPELNDCEALMIESGKLIYWEGSTPIELSSDEKTAIGSGGPYALAAMDFGKSAIDAVEYAATRDCYTGNGVDAVSIKGRGK